MQPDSNLRTSLFPFGLCCTFFKCTQSFYKIICGYAPPGSRLFKGKRGKNEPPALLWGKATGSRAELRRKHHVRTAVCLLWTVMWFWRTVGTSVSAASLTWVNWTALLELKKPFRWEVERLKPGNRRLNALTRFCLGTICSVPQQLCQLSLLLTIYYAHTHTPLAQTCTCIIKRELLFLQWNQIFLSQHFPKFFFVAIFVPSLKWNSPTTLDSIFSVSVYATPEFHITCYRVTADLQTSVSFHFRFILQTGRPERRAHNKCLIVLVVMNAPSGSDGSTKAISHTSESMTHMRNLF